MACVREIEKNVLQNLEQRGPCSIEEMVKRLPGYTWNQVFTAVDRLSRDARVTLQHPSPFEYQISIAQVGRASPAIAVETVGERLGG